MRWMKWTGLMATVLLVVSCFTPWVVIESRNMVISGIDTTGTNFGKPGYLHFILTGLFLIFLMIPRIWAKRSNLLICAVNIAWSVRNFIIITACHMGECPDKKPGIYLTIFASAIMLLSSFFPDIKLKPSEPEKPV